MFINVRDSKYTDIILQVQSLKLGKQSRQDREAEHPQTFKVHAEPHIQLQRTQQSNRRGSKGERKWHCLLPSLAKINPLPSWNCSALRSRPCRKASAKLQSSAAWHCPGPLPLLPACPGEAPIMLIAMQMSDRHGDSQDLLSKWCHVLLRCWIRKAFLEYMLFPHTSVLSWIRACYSWGLWEVKYHCFLYPQSPLVYVTAPEQDWSDKECWAPEKTAATFLQLLKRAMSPRLGMDLASRECSEVSRTLCERSLWRQYNGVGERTEL